MPYSKICKKKAKVSHLDPANQLWDYGAQNYDFLSSLRAWTFNDL